MSGRVCSMDHYGQRYATFAAMGMDESRIDMKKPWIGRSGEGKLTQRRSRAGKDAFHRVPKLPPPKKWDAVERVLSALESERASRVKVPHRRSFLPGN
jgi:hypothetical protein